GRLHDVAVTEDDEGGRLRGGLLRPEANDTLVDVRERGVASWHRLAERGAGWQPHVHELRRNGQPFHRSHESSIARLADNDPNRRPSIRRRLRELGPLQIAVLRPAHLFARRRFHPHLYP